MRFSLCNLSSLKPFQSLLRIVPNPLPASFIRGGTSKGIFLNRKHLPSDTELWRPIFSSIMGSPDPVYQRQLNGMGGGISSLSKIVVVGNPTKTSNVPDPVDIEYTFVQVGVGDGELDLSGNCGNLTTAVGVFALDEGICKIPSLELYPSCNGEDMNRRKATIKLKNTNTDKIIRTSFPVDLQTGLATLEESEIEIAGVPGMGSRVLLEFLNPAGAKTRRLLPSGKATDRVMVGGGKEVEVSCVDATNPTVFVDVNSVLGGGSAKSSWINDASLPLSMLEDIRRQAAVLMGMDPHVQAQPKICIVGSPESEGYDLVARALSMGAPHKAIPCTVALCLAAAAGMDSTIVHGILRGNNNAVIDGDGVAIKIGIPGGVVGVRAKFEGQELKSVAIERTARRLMRGEVFW
ncbi:PrpF protein [Trichophaea hybrida]|nr:PrpF protein [Trichophaea hybrida]